MSRHLLIAGTGRAGTSFLVRYLTRLGLDTHLSRGGDAAEWHEAARAGLEDIMRPGAILPYVVKSPWSYQVIEDVLARGEIQFDAAVIPLRDLTEAAASRAIVEMQSMYRTSPWIAALGKAWEHVGQTPGGIVYSMSPVDQARLLAVGFHHLLHQLVRAEVPVVLLDFPRLVEDADYLVRTLLPVLPAGISPEDARAAHADTADPDQVRVGKELRDPSEGFHLDFPDPDRLDRAALARLLVENRRALRAAREEAANAAMAVAEREAALAQSQEEQRQAQAWVANAQAAAASAKVQRDDASQRLAETKAALAAARAETDGLQAHLREEQAEAAHLRQRLAAIESSGSWQTAQALERAPLLAAAVTRLLPRASRPEAEPPRT